MLWMRRCGANHPDNNQPYNHTQGNAFETENIISLFTGPGQGRNNVVSRLPHADPYARNQRSDAVRRKEARMPAPSLPTPRQCLPRAASSHIATTKNGNQPLTPQKVQRCSSFLLLLLLGLITTLADTYCQCCLIITCPLTWAAICPGVLGKKILVLEEEEAILTQDCCLYHSVAHRYVRACTERVWRHETSNSGRGSVPCFVATAVEHRSLCRVV